MQLNKDLIKLIHQEIEQGFILTQKHPSLDINIYNYSKRCAYDWRWNEATSICRGLILDSNYNIIARPLEKFFTYEQCIQMGIEIPKNVPYKIYSKEDGSLGIFWSYKDQFGIATRGSFTSDQAIEGTKILSEMFSADMIYDIIKSSDKVTHLFEIVYPENRIVVDYKDYRGLIYLCSINKETSQSYVERDMFVERAEPIGDSNLSFEELKAFNEENKEGMVFYFDNGFKMKLKFEDYCELHKLYCNMSVKTLWEMLKEGKSEKEIVIDLPDELYEWASNEIDEILQKLEFHYTKICNIFNSYVKESNHKRIDFVKFVNEQEKMYHCFLFNLYDGKNIKTNLFSLVKPKQSKKFNSI